MMHQLVQYHQGVPDIRCIAGLGPTVPTEFLPPNSLPERLLAQSLASSSASNLFASIFASSLTGGRLVTY